MKRTNIQPERIATQRAKYRAYVQRQIAKQNKVEREVPKWTWTLDTRTGTVEANTRSEAKARIKEALNVKRLPKEVLLVAQTK